MHPLWFDDDHDPLLSWLDLVGISVPVEVLSYQGIGETSVEIFINPYHLATNLKRAARIGGVDQRKCDTWLAQQIPVLLAGFVCAKKDMGSIPVEQQRAHSWFSLWPDRRHMCQCGGVQDVLILFWNN